MVKMSVMKNLAKHLSAKTALMSVFGASECHIMLSKRVVNLSHADYPSSIIPIGRPLPGITCLLLDDNQRLITNYDQIGELYIGGKLIT